MRASVFATWAIVGGAGTDPHCGLCTDQRWTIVCKQFPETP